MPAMPAPAARDGAREPWPLALLDAATQGVNVCGSVLILALMLLIVADVLGRNLFGAPVPGVPEMVTLSIVAIVFLQSPQALRAGRMPRSEALMGTLEKRAPAAARLLADAFDVAGVAVAGIIAWSTWPLFVRAWTRGDYVGALGDFTAPVWPVKAIIVLGSTLMGLQFLARALRRHGVGRPS